MAMYGELYVGEVCIAVIVAVACIMSLAACFNSIFDDAPRPPKASEAYVSACMKVGKVPNVGDNESKNWTCTK